jgi:serine/threonine protein kinase
MRSPYIKGATLALKMHRPGTKSFIPQLDGCVEKLRVEIVDIIEPSTISIVLQVELEQQDPSDPTPRMILKVYDRQYSPQLREFKDTGPATSASEDEFSRFVRGGFMPQFLEGYEQSGPWDSWAYGEWDVAKREAYFYARSIQSHEVELEIYDRLADIQGIHVPTIFADVRLAPQHGTTGKDESLTQYTEVRAILMEYIPGFPLSGIVTEVPESDWAPICDQAIDVIMRITDNDFINFDIKPRNIIVRRSEADSYQVFYLDFGECGFRDPSDSDEMWRERKRQKDEEGAVGYIMMNYISRAKGKKGKKYKGTLPLPWEYKPSLRFDGEYIELYENAGETVI